MQKKPDSSAAVAALGAKDRSEEDDGEKVESKVVAASVVDDSPLSSKKPHQLKQQIEEMTERFVAHCQRYGQLLSRVHKQQNGEAAAMTTARGEEDSGIYYD
jgi:hypothetical protein